MFQGNNFLRFIYIFVIAAFALFAFSVIYKQFFSDGSEMAIIQAQSKDVPGDLLAYERNTISVFQNASPSVVFVHNLQNRREFFSFNVTEVQAGSGSGFLWDRAGHIVTNYHVVQGASRVAVTLIDGNTYNAEKVGFEPRKDLAVLKIDLKRTNVKPFGDKVADSANVQVGQKAPEIELYSDEKELFKLSDHEGDKNVVLLFFPGAFTGVCTTEMNMVNNDIAEYGEDTQIVGISTDSPFALAEFKKVHGFTFPLLSDHDAVYCAKYGAKFNHDFTPMKFDRIAKRAAFVVGKDGNIAHMEITASPGDLPDLDAVKAALNV